MRFHLFCLKCHATYSIPEWAMKHMTYREYSYCDKCYIEKEGKPRSLFAKMFTKKGRKTNDIDDLNRALAEFKAAVLQSKLGHAVHAATVWMVNGIAEALEKIAGGKRK